MSQADLETIGRFRVERLLGSGGMGAVYLAEDPVLKRRVAVKVVQGSGSQQEGMARFRREAEVSARLNHPNVITIYDVGEDPKAGPFIAMEFVDGSSLGELIQGRALRGPVDRLRILIDAMRAIEAAHAASVVHRDIKPGNLMVGRDGRVKLMDFGVARNEDSGLTMTGAVIGTPSYISPEQLKGAPPSAATDCYAFFVMAFEVFTAAKPFSGPATVTLLYNIAHQPPTFPEDLSPALRRVFERALAKNPTERHPDLRSFLAAMIQAAVTDPAERGHLLHEIGPVAGGPSPVDAAANETDVAVPLAISEGMGSRSVALIAAGVTAIAVIAGAGAYRFTGGGAADSRSPIVIAEASPPRATPLPAPSAAPRREPSPPRQSLDDSAPVLVATVAPMGRPPRWEAREPRSGPGQRPVALVSLGKPSLEPTAGPRALPTPSAADLRTAVSDALREQGMRHVRVTLTGGHQLLLGNLRDAGEAERARALAARITDGELNIETALREEAQPAPRKVTRRVASDEPAALPDEPRTPDRPVWEIRPEGSERTD